MKKSFYLCAILILCSITSKSQSWTWVKQAGSTSYDEVKKLCTDPSGNVYIIGQFGDKGLATAYMLFNNDTIYNNGDNQIYVAKYSGVGNVLWAKGIGGYNTSTTAGCACEYAGDIVYDNGSNSLIMTGSLIGTSTFGNITLTGANSPFISKLDTNGNFIWTKLITSSVNINTNKISIDTVGNIYISGNCTDSVEFDTVRISPGGFIAKYSTNGDVIWAKSIIAGSVFQKIIPFQDKIYSLIRPINSSFTIDTANYYSANIQKVIFSCFTNSGHLMWLKFSSTRGLSSAAELVKDPQGNFIIIGTFNTNISFGTDSVINQNMLDMFLVKYDQNGNVLWLNQAHASNIIRGSDIVISKTGNIYIAGYIDGNASFGSFNISSSSSDDIYVAKYKTDGTCTQIIHLGPVSIEHITVDSSENLFLGGEFYGPLSIGNTSMTSIGSSDIFLAKHDPLLDSGYEKISQDNQLLIYANPNTGKCTITIPDDFMKEKNLTLKIYDNSGKQISNSSIEIGEDRIKLNLEARAKGMYQAVLTNGHKSYSGKIVFQ